jgi:hypothetical protein
MRIKFAGTLLGFAFLCNFAHAQAQSDKDSNWNYIYLNHFNELFNQTSATTSEAYKSATPVQREKLLEEHFLKTKLEIVVKSAKGALFALGAGAITMIGGTILVAKGYIGLPSMLASLNPLLVASTSLGATLTALVCFYRSIMSLGNALVNQVSGAFTAIGQYLSGSTADPMERHEIRYVRKKPMLAPGLAKSVEEAIYEARTTDPSLYSAKDAGRLAPLLIDKALSLPTTVKELPYNRTKIDELFKCYSEETKDELHNLIIIHIAGIHKGPGSQKRIAFFKGPPGTGKSRAAKLVAKALDVAFQEISLADVKKEDFVGHRKSKDATPGLIANAMIRASKEGSGLKNFMLLVEEADRVLNMKLSGQLGGLSNYMLMFLDPGKGTYYNEFFNADIDVSDIGIILAGNYDIEDEALKNRVHVVNFDAISLECKREIVWNEYFPELFAKYNKSRFAFKEEDFTQKDRDAFDEIIQYDTDPGMRSIYRELEEYIAKQINHKAKEKLIKLESDTKSSDLEPQAEPTSSFMGILSWIPGL